MNDKRSTINNKTVVVIDGGGRGSALVDAYLSSKNVNKVIAIPGNDLMVKKNVTIFPEFKTTDIKDIVTICKKEKADLVDVAQDDAVAVGLVNKVNKEGINTFGPTKEAGRIEWDKAWARLFMKKSKIPSPTFKICKSQKEGISFIKNKKDSQWFIKASGLAAGKGALFAENNKDALAKIKQMKSFGTAGKTYLIEECLTGEEFSSFWFVSGNNYQLIGHAQDHKTVFDGNLGPNTGGMGCSSPPQVVTGKIEKQIEKIIKKTVAALVKLNRPYNGILYFGGMVDQKGKVYCIEFNSRWGDPEAQVLIPALKNDYYKLISEASSGKLHKIKKDKLYRVVVAAVSKGYPADYSKVVGMEIKGLSQLIKKGTTIYGAGVKRKGKKYIAASGRLFYIIGEGKNVVKARQKAYNILSYVSISGNNLHYRTDIGYRDLERVK